MVCGSPPAFTMQKTFILSFLLLLPAFPVLAQSGSEAARDTNRMVFDIRSEGGNKYLKITHELRNDKTELRPDINQAVH